MIKTFFPILLLLFSNLCWSQTYIQGNITTDFDNLPLANSTIMLIDSKDSILFDFSLSDDKGNFQIKRPINGTYRLLISYPEFADYSKIIDENTNATNLGNIKLSSIEHLIEEVVIQGKRPVTIRGDTTEYDASFYKMEKNSKVEDLLKVLPGISVDPSGNITAQGKVVKKVLLDGEEFFGTDPKLVTRNIRSDMVSKVQLYEKKSDLTERTGADDGQREQTINIQLKEEAKEGIFGKVMAGITPNKYYTGQAMFNKFSKNKKISVYGLFGNEGSTEMSRDDAAKYQGDEGGTDVDINNSLTVFDPFSGSQIIGVPSVLNTGFNFNNKWKENKHNLNLTYKYGNIKSEGESETNMNGVINSISKNYLDTDNQLHNINLRYDFNIDSLNLLTVKSNISKRKLFSDNQIQSENLLDNFDVTSENSSNETSDNKIDNYNFDLIYTKKFNKKGRSITLSGAANNQDLKGISILNSQYKSYLQNEGKNIEQRKKNKQELTLLRSNLTYTEPLSKRINISLGLGVENNKNLSLVESFNKAPNGEFTEFDASVSSNYEYNRLGYNYRLGLNFKSEKIQANMTNVLNNDRLHQQDYYSDKNLTRDFFTYNPRLYVKYSISKNKQINLNYTGQNQLPKLNQIQPIINNSDPINIVEGNQELTPSFKNNISINYVSFKLLSGAYTYAQGTFSTISDPIVQSLTQSNGINYYKWNNAKNKIDINSNLYGGIHMNLNKELGLSNSIQGSVGFIENNGFFDNKNNIVRTTQYNLTYQFVRNTKTGLNVDLRFTPQYRKMKSNLSEDQNNNGFVFSQLSNIQYFLPKSFKVYIDVEYSYEAPTQAFDQKLERVLIHPGISKKFLKNESLMLDFRINDILDQNVGYSRAQQNSIFIQKRYDTIRRYYMLKLSWDFTKSLIK